MFQQAKSIERAFQLLRLYCLIWFVGCGVLTAFVVYRSLGIVRGAENRIYVLSGGKAVAAMAEDRREDVVIEARDHIHSFLGWFFTMDPDEKVINANIGRALYLADGSAKRLYDNLKENGYYSGIVSGNISQQIVVDSIRLDVTGVEPYFKSWARLLIVRPTSMVTRSLVTEGWLRAVARSDHNPHGFLIERWNTLENKDLKVENR